MTITQYEYTIVQYLINTNMLVFHIKNEWF